MLYALVKEGAIVRQQEFDGQPPALSPNKGEWLMLIIPAGPVVDSATQRIERVVNINPNNVTITFTVIGRPIAEAKINRRKDVMAEALSRVGELPALTDFDIYDAARAAQAAIDAMSDIATIRAYNAATDPAWP